MNSFYLKESIMDKEAKETFVRDIYALLGSYGHYWDISEFIDYSVSSSEFLLAAFNNDQQKLRQLKDSCSSSLDETDYLQNADEIDEFLHIIKDLKGILLKHGMCKVPSEVKSTSIEIREIYTIKCPHCNLEITKSVKTSLPEGGLIEQCFSCSGKYKIEGFKKWI